MPVRDPYPGNVIPAGDPLRSQVAARITQLMVRPDRPGNSFNVAGNPSGDQTWNLDARNIMFRADHGFTPNFRMSHSFYWNRRPSIRNCGEVGGCTTPNDGETAPETNDTYYGAGFYQRISTHHAHQQFDWVIKPNLLNHATVAYDRWFMGGNSLSAGVGWPQRLFGANQGGILNTTGGPPVMNFDGTIDYTSVGQNWPRFGFLVNNRWQFSDDLTWVKGRHNFKAGFEYRWHQFPFRGWGAGTAGAFDFNRLGTGGYDALGNNLAQTGDRVRVVPARPGPFVESNDPGDAHVPRGLHGGVDQRRIQGERSPDADARPALRLSVRAHGSARSVFDVQSDDAESGGGQHSWRADLRG